MTCAGRTATLGLSALLVAASTMAQAETCARIEAIQSGDLQSAPLMDASCQNYVTLGGKTASSCLWSYTLDAPDASRFADDLWAETRSCVPGAKILADQPVNHPDSYALNQWRTAQGTFAVSLKRKGALGQTLVHLRFEPASEN